MSLFEQLKNKYPVRQIALFGDCIIIPTAEFEKDWEKRLKEEGYMSHVVQIDYHSQWAVQLRKAEVYKKEPISPPPGPGNVSTHTTTPEPAKLTNAGKAEWTDEDKDRLMKRWVEVTPTTAMGKAREIVKEFPGRSAQALYLMHYELTGGKTTHQRKPRKNKPEPAAATNKYQEDLDKLEKITNAIQKVTEPIYKKIADLEKEIEELKFKNIREVADEIPGIKQDILHLIHNTEEIDSRLEGHKHYPPTGEVMFPAGIKK